NDVFGKVKFDKLPGRNAIGHVRYTTAGGRTIENVQPLLFRTQTGGSMALAQNGNILNSRLLRAELENKGSILQTSSDTELLAHLIRRGGQTANRKSIAAALNQIVGAYTFVI